MRCATLPSIWFSQGRQTLCWKISRQNPCFLPSCSHNLTRYVVARLNTVKPVLKEDYHKRPPVLKDHIFMAEGPTFQYISTCHKWLPVLIDHISVAIGAMFENRFCCTALSVAENYIALLISRYVLIILLLLWRFEFITSIWFCCVKIGMLMIPFRYNFERNVVVHRDFWE